MDLAILYELALSPEFEAIELGSTLFASIENTIVHRQSFNVGGLLPGSEAPGEAFIYTAHWDHIGTGKSDDPLEDVIYNGAVDNATGTAALIELARAFGALEHRPRRSVAFLAVTAEESGLLGSAWYAEHPAFPMPRTAGGINIDGMSVNGPTDDVVVVGYGASELEDHLRTAAEAQGRTIEPEPNPERGSFYRSDHFNFAKMGVPMLYARSGLEHREHGRGYLEAKRDEYTRVRYHQPDDEVLDDWDLRGAMEDLQLYFDVGLGVADSEDWPKWYEGSEFKAIRENSQR
jgi:Zn-dependent M28 family amino/carboxypeptidase